MFDPQADGEFGGYAGEGDGGAASGLAADFDVAPGYAMAEAGAEGLEGGLFGGEAGGEALQVIALGGAVRDLGGGEDTAKKALAEALEGLADPGNLCDINPCAYDHFCFAFYSALCILSCCFERSFSTRKYRFSARLPALAFASSSLNQQEGNATQWNKEQ